MASNDQLPLNEMYTFQEPRPQIFSLPLPIIKYLIDHSTPAVWKKLIKTCKYFYPKNPVYPIFQIKAVTGYKWNADGEVFDSTKFTPKIWLYDSIVIKRTARDFEFYFDNPSISSLIPMIAVNEIRNLDIFYQDLSWEDYQFITSSPKFERLDAYDCSIKYSDDTFVTYDKLLENLPSLKYFQVGCNWQMFEPDTVKKLVPILSNFKTEPFISFRDLPRTCNFPDFIDFIMKNETVNIGVTFSYFRFSWGGRKQNCENLINSVLANPPKRIPKIDILPYGFPGYKEYQELYKERNA